MRDACRAARAARRATRIADLREGRDRLEQRLVARLQPGRAHARAVQPLRRVDEALQFARLLPERLDHAHARDALVDDLRDVALALLPVPRRGEDAPAHPVRHREQRRHHDERQQREQRRQREHHRRATAASSAGCRSSAAGSSAAPWTSVESELARDTSCPVGILARVATVEALQVVVHGVAQVELHAECRPGRRGTGARRRARTSAAAAANSNHQPRPQRVAPRDDDLVDDLAGDQRDEHLRRAADHRGATASSTLRRWCIAKPRKPPRPNPGVALTARDLRCATIAVEPVHRAGAAAAARSSPAGSSAPAPRASRCAHRRPRPVVQRGSHRPAVSRSVTARWSSRPRPRG